MNTQQTPVIVMNQNIKKDTGPKVQLQNIGASKAVADVIRTCLGPRTMLKMLLDPMGRIVLTNDGHSILREIDVSHPAAKSMLEISRGQDEEVGDGTTSVIILAGELMSATEPILRKGIHPSLISKAYGQALEDSLDYLKTSGSFQIDVNENDQLLDIIKTSLATKYIGRWSSLACELAIQAVKTVVVERSNGTCEIDIKRYVRLEKIPGGDISDSKLIDGVVLNKDVTHAKMKRRIENPRVVLLDCTLEYKKGESQTDIEVIRGEDWNTLLKQEEEVVRQMCAHIIAVKPDLVVTEKGISDLAQYYFQLAGISCIRRVKKTDNNRISRACGARIVNRPDDIREEDVGTRAALFEVKKIGDEYFTFLHCTDAKACTILLRGPSKDILNEIGRNIMDGMSIVRNVLLTPRLCPGGGACEMSIAHMLRLKAKELASVEQECYEAIADSLEAIPRTLVQNCGANVVRTITRLRGIYASTDSKDLPVTGINGETGELENVVEKKILDSLSVKMQVLKSAIEYATMMIRIDVIVSGLKKK